MLAGFHVYYRLLLQGIFADAEGGHRLYDELFLWITVSNKEEDRVKINSI